MDRRLLPKLVFDVSTFRTSRPRETGVSEGLGGYTESGERSGAEG